MHLSHYFGPIILNNLKCIAYLISIIYLYLYYITRAPPIPYLISLSNCDASSVPSIASQFGLKTEYALGSPRRFGADLVFKQIKTKADNTK